LRKHGNFVGFMRLFYVRLLINHEKDDYDDDNRNNNRPNS